MASGRVSLHLKQEGGGDTRGDKDIGEFAERDRGGEEEPGRLRRREIAGSRQGDRRCHRHDSGTRAGGSLSVHTLCPEG